MKFTAKAGGAVRARRGWRMSGTLLASVVLAAGLTSPAPVGVPDPFLELLADFNGDGFRDLAVGVPGETFGGAGEGAVQVIYGGPDGLDGDRPVDDQFWAQDSPGIGETAQLGDNFGASLAWGDFNGDGYHDLAVGVPFEDLHDGTSALLQDAGVIHVIYGSPTGLTTAGSLVLSQDTAGILDPAEADDYFGWRLAAGNFGNGPESDLAVGVPGENLSVPGAGAVNVIYGSAAGLGATGNQFWHQDSPGISGTAEEGDMFGYSLAAANFGNGSLADLAVGVVYEDLDAATQQDAGAVHVIYGSTTGLTATGNAMWHQDSPGISGVAEEGDFFGRSLAAANFGNSAEADLAVGAAYEDVGDEDAGAVNVIYGSATGLAAGGNQLWHLSRLGFYAQTRARFGFSLAAANFGRGSQADLAVGVPNEHVQEHDAGAVVVFYGSSTGLSESGWNFLSQHGELGGDAEAADLFGFSVAAANFGKGPEADLAIGVPGEDHERFLFDDHDVGAVNVVYGSASGLTATGNQFWWQRSDNLHDSGEPADSFGRALA